MEQLPFVIAKSERIHKLVDALYEHMPEIEADRGVLVTESYRATEHLPIIKRRSAAFMHILKNIPIVIRDHELIVGSNSQAPRGCQVFPEYSYEWLEAEFDTVATREADPFYISEQTKARLREVYPYWKGKTNSDLARELMDPAAYAAFTVYNMFTPGNYFYNGIGHVNVNYKKVLAIGYEGIRAEAADAMARLDVAEADYNDRRLFLEAVIESCDAVMIYAARYAELARKLAAETSDPTRHEELLHIARNCDRVPAKGARDFYEACQSFWFVQSLLQVESSGHSISPGRFDQYMYPYYARDIADGRITREGAQELIDCIYVKLNDLNKVRDAASAEGFAGYGLFQNLIVGGQTADGADATNDLSFMCMEASMHVALPQPSLSIRVYNGSPQPLLIKAASVTRTGMGIPAYYNDEIIIPALLSRGLTLEEARDYCIIGCVEPQIGSKTDGWHDAAFFNMCRPMELVFSSGKIGDEQVGLPTGDVAQMTDFEQFFDAYKAQQAYMIKLLVNANCAIDRAHAIRCPLPFESCMVDDCIGRGKSMQEGGAKYNFTGPQGFGIANMTDALVAVRELVFEKKLTTLSELRDALRDNFGVGLKGKPAAAMTETLVRKLAEAGVSIDEQVVRTVYREVSECGHIDEATKARYTELRALIDACPKYGNDLPDIDALAREVAYSYTREVEKYKNPRGGIFQAGLYPVSANVPLGAQTGATPDGRLAFTPIADGVGPCSGKDTCGPTAAANSVAKLDHAIASNGTLFNQKFHPSALSGMAGLTKFVAYIRSFFDQKGMHMQFNVVTRQTLLDAQQNPEKYKTLVVRVAGYSALFTTLSRSLQDDIINRTEQGF